MEDFRKSQVQEEVVGEGKLQSLDLKGTLHGYQIKIKGLAKNANPLICFVVPTGFERGTRGQAMKIPVLSMFIQPPLMRRWI